MGPNAARSAAVAAATADAAANDFAATVVSRPPPAVDLRLGGPDSEPAPLSVPSDFPTLPGVDAPADDAAAPPSSGGAGLGHIGRYELQRVLGRGGLGTVYEARDPLLSRTVAVKTLQFDAAPGARVALDRLFLNEARAAAGLSHPHIVTVFDAGLSAHGVYIAMERLRGRDLRQALAEGWRPSPAQAVLLARRVADALAYAHARGVVHCDIKPANIFLGRSGKPKLLDFGIARIVRRAPAGGVDADPVAAGATAPGPLDGLVAGSPHYLAPEQLRGEAVDGRSDVYALGVVLYELLTGRKAFAGDSLAAIHAAVLEHAVPPANALDPSLPPALALLVARAMARDPADRPTGAAEFAQALRPWHEGLEAEAAERASRPVADAAAATAPARTGHADDAQDNPRTLPDAARTAGPGPRRSGLITGAAALGLIVAAAVGALAWFGPEDDPAPTGPAVATTGPAVATTSPVAAPPTGTTIPDAVAAAPTGELRLAIRPGGSAEVDGNPVGEVGPRSTLTLPAGPHLVIVRRPGEPAFIAEVEVRPDAPTTLAHRFAR